MGYQFSFSRLAHILVSLFLTGWILIVGKFLLAPLAFSLLFAFMLIPLCAWVEKWIPNRFLAILVTFLLALLPVAGVLTLFGFQLATVLGDLENIGSRLSRGLQDLVVGWEEYFVFSEEQIRNWTDLTVESLVQGSGDLLGLGISSSTAVIGSLILVFLFTFFMLLYRTAFKNFFLIQFEPEQREEVGEILYSVQTLTRHYLYGMMLVMAILAVLNSLGLWLIGIEYAVFWGCLAAFLAIIPYLGTTLGGTLPFLYALATTGTWWQPAAVVALYFSVQQIEGNFITPKVVGGSVDINPMAAIISLFLGGVLWGVSGLILALPALAAIKVTMEHIPRLEPLAHLLDSRLFAKQDLFFEKYDDAQYRLSQLFKRKES